MGTPRRVMKIADSTVKRIELRISRPNGDGGLVAAEDTRNVHRQHTKQLRLIVAPIFREA